MAKDSRREVVAIGTDLKLRQERMVTRLEALVEEARAGRIEGIFVVAILPEDGGYKAHWAGNARLSLVVGATHRALADIMALEPGQTG